MVQGQQAGPAPAVLQEPWAAQSHWIPGGVSENGALSLSTSSPWKSEVQQIHLLIHSFNIYALSIYRMAAVVLGAEKIVGNKIFLAHEEFFIQNDGEWE